MKLIVRLAAWLGVSAGGLWLLPACGLVPDEEMLRYTGAPASRTVAWQHGGHLLVDNDRGDVDVAPGTAAPEGSRTRPVMAPVRCCAMEEAARANAAQTWNADFDMGRRFQGSERATQDYETDVTMRKEGIRIGIKWYRCPWTIPTQTWRR